MRERAPLEIVIAGGGTAGWTAAATFARFLGNHATITLVESDAIGTVGVGEATIPQIHNLIIGLGLDQAEFLRDTNASFKLGHRIRRLAAARALLHPQLRPGRARRRADPVPPALAARARARGRPAIMAITASTSPPRGSGALRSATGGDGAAPDLAYAYHFDATLFAQMLRRYAEDARRRPRIEGLIETRRARSATAAISARCGSTATGRVAGTLFIDCTGFRSLLLGDALGVPFVDWTPLAAVRHARSPCRASTSPAFRPTPNRSRAPPGGSGASRSSTAPATAMSSAPQFMSVDEASDLLLANLDGERRSPIRARSASPPATGAILVAQLRRAGARRGVHGAARIDQHPSRPVGHRAAAQSACRRSVRRRRPRATRSTACPMIEWQRDPRFPRPPLCRQRARRRAVLGSLPRASNCPTTLAEKIDLFREAGLFMREEDELFLDDSWGQVMIGQGITPRGWSPLADNVPGARYRPVPRKRSPTAASRQGRSAARAPRFRRRDDWPTRWSNTA